MHCLPFTKYHGLGNDYLVVRQQHIDEYAPTQAKIEGLTKAICARHFGVGSDGLLIDCSDAKQFRLRIINPDGSEAEKSGNGLRIFARWLYDNRHVQQNKLFSVHTKGGVVGCQVLQEGESIQVSMGKVYIGMNAKMQNKKDCLNNILANKHLLQPENLAITGKAFACYRVNVGNPHCVIPIDNALSQEDLATFGHQIERHRTFPSRTNVQFIRKGTNKEIAIQIWERGAGITLASGSSATAAAAVARVLGWCNDNVIVQMTGGKLYLSFTSDGTAHLEGPVVAICHGDFLLACT